MDSLKISKGGGGSKSSGSIPLAVRFNAEEESIEELIKPKEASQLNSPSPQQNLDDFSWKTIQGNLFHRNRSGSIEGISSASGSNIISNLSNSDINTIGTWKLIKGKVSQAMEDIKSSKNVQMISKTELVNDDSDQETTSVNVSISELTNSSSALHVKFGTSGSIGSTPVQESDSDLDLESTDDLQSLSLRRSLANLRSRSYIKSAKVRSSKQKQQQSQLSPSQQHLQPQPQTQQKRSPVKKDESPTRFSSIKAESFLKRRKYDKEKHTSTSTIESSSQKNLKLKRDSEIESGIEMVEDMVLPSNTISDNCQSIYQETTKDCVLGMSIVDEMITFKQCPKTDDKSIWDNQLIVEHLKKLDSTEKITSTNSQKQLQQTTILEGLTYIWINFSKKFSAIATLLLLLVLLILPLPGFFCGVFTCLFTIFLFSCIADYGKILITDKNNFGLKSKFEIPSHIQVCEIPAAEEHLSLKSYSGWMNEINNYDPANHHLSMTTPVFVKLNGSNITLSNTSSRIPKRAMWNEAPLDKANISFTRTRYFNLQGCRVEMCPKGLARKRHFSRKYPIQLIIKNSDASKVEMNSSKLSTQELSEQVGDAGKNEVGGRSSLDDNLKISCDGVEGKRHSLNESSEDLSEKSYKTSRHSDGFDFGNAISNSDIQKLQNTYEVVSKEGVPCGDETRVLLFARCDREKEDWYRRFYAASKGLICDQQEPIPDIVMFSDDEIAIAIKATSSLDGSGEISPAEEKGKTKVLSPEIIEPENHERKTSEDSLLEGILITSCALRNPPDYIRFMAKYQKACFQSSCSTSTKVTPSTTDNTKRNRREKNKEDDLWKGIDQALYRQPSGKIIWFNIIIGRILFNCLNNRDLLDRIQEFLQRKLSAIRLPSFMEDVVIDQLDLGDTPPLIHRISQPVLDERGTWIDADISYEGLMHMTITTKLNLLRLKRQQHQDSCPFDSTQAGGLTTNPTDGLCSSINGGGGTNNTSAGNLNSNNLPGKSNSNPSIVNCAIYDSNAESTGASSSESESFPVGGTVDSSSESHSSFYTTPGSSRRFLRIVDRITASNLFQSATEISYIQRAMENMSTKITLKVELKGLVSRIVVNFPPPPSDRVWCAFRGPPRLWISAKPTVGDHAFDWSIVTTIIENKLCDEVYKYLVYPNMVDIIVPILGEPTYKEED